MDKLKDMASKATGSSGGSTGKTGSATGGTESSSYSKYTDKGVDMATDKLGMGDKYDTKIGDQVDKQVNSYTNKK